MGKANDEFQRYITTLSEGSKEDILTAYNRYQKARSEITSDMCNTEHNRWTVLTNENDSKTFWAAIDWKCSLSKQNTLKPQVDELASYFENLYKFEDENKLVEIEKLESEIYIPVIDDPIKQEEVDIAVKTTKKGGYDFKLSSLHTILDVPLLLLILNMFFYVSYPISLAVSLHSAKRERSVTTEL